MLSRPEIGSRAHMKLWVASKDPNEEYNWDNPVKCVCGQYSSEHGASPDRWLIGNNMGSLNQIAGDYPRTFGALHERICNAWSDDT